jgi:biopolymer transport protein TolR
MAMMGGNQKAQINVTPMIDVLLVLIIIFLVITPQSEVGLKALVPQPAPADAQPQPPSHDIVITVRSDRSVQLNQEPVELAKLQERLARLFRNAADHVVFIRGDRNLDFRQVAEVIDIARGAGLTRIALTTRE